MGFIQQDMGHKALVLLSGGLDSAACAHFLIDKGFLVEALFIDYGQVSASREVVAAKKIAKFLSIPFKEFSVNTNIKKTSGEIKGRNAFLLFTALLEFPEKSGIIGIGIHDGTSYFDCSENFINQVQILFDDYTNGCVKIITPFVNWSKGEIWNYLNKSSFPVDVTYSCELGLPQPCGRCLSCEDLEELYASEKLKINS